MRTYTFRRSVYSGQSDLVWVSGWKPDYTLFVGIWIKRTGDWNHLFLAPGIFLCSGLAVFLFCYDADESEMLGTEKTGKSRLQSVPFFCVRGSSLYPSWNLDGKLCQSKPPWIHLIKMDLSSQKVYKCDLPHVV